MTRSKGLTAGLRRNPPYRMRTGPTGVPVILYDTALNQLAYGQAPQMGDFFNDVMGAVVPAWDKRPDWMKKIVVKPDPAKLIQAASKVVKPAQAGALVDQANRAGVNLFYNTPAGQVPVSGDMAQNAMTYGPGYYSAYNAASSVPVWVYAVGGLAVLSLLLMRK